MFRPPSSEAASALLRPCPRPPYSVIAVPWSHYFEFLRSINTTAGLLAELSAIEFSMIREHDWDRSMPVAHHDGRRLTAGSSAPMSGAGMP